MSSYEYSPVGAPSSSQGKTKSTTSFHFWAVSPLFHFLADAIHHLVPSVVVVALGNGARTWRNIMAYRPFRYCPLISNTTIAHVLLSLPLLGLCITATDIAIFKPNSHHALKNTGKLASYAMTCAFLTANKSHSLVSLVTGLSFERLVPFHLASALVTLWMGLMHAIQIAYFHRGDNATHHHDNDEDHDHDHGDGDVDGDHDDDEDHHHHDDNDEDDHDHDDHDGHHRILHHDTDSIHAYLGNDPNLWKFFLDGNMNTSGFIVLVSLIVVVVTSVFHPLFRKWWFEGWLIYHITGVLLILTAGIIHGADIFVFVVIWWALDLIIRYGLMVAVRYPRQAQITRVADNVTKIQFTKTKHFQYEAGQFVQVSIPSIKLWEYHPISIASAPNDNDHNNNDANHDDSSPQVVTLYVRALVDGRTWTRQLYDLAAPRDDNKMSTSSVRIFLEGPYGSVPSILAQPNIYSMAVFICGGIGATPCHSITQRLVSSRQHSSLQKIWYIWSIKDEGMIKAIPPSSLEIGSKIGKGKNDFDDDSGIELVECVKPTGEDEDDNAAHGEVQGKLEDDSTQSALTLQTDIYVTQMTKFLDEGFEDAEEHHGTTVGKEVDPSYTIHEGNRPDVYGIMNQVKTEALKIGWGRVFVMGCGPVPMLNDIQAACRLSQSEGIQIDYEQENFDY